MCTLTADAGISTDVVIRPGQQVLLTGGPGLAVAPSWGSGSFTVQENAALTLAGVRLGQFVTRCIVTGGGSLTLMDLGLPAEALTAIVTRLNGAGSSLTLVSVTVPGNANIGALTGTVTSDDYGGRTINPQNLNGAGALLMVLSGPCELAEGGRCAGRPGGYRPNERCDIVAVGDLVIDSCPVFSIDGQGDEHPGDYLETPDGLLHNNGYWDGVGNRHNDNCPAGLSLQSGQVMHWVSNARDQGA